MQFVLLSYELLKPLKKMKMASKTSSSEVSRYYVIFYWLFRILQFKNHAYFFLFWPVHRKKDRSMVYLCKLKQSKNASITTASPALHACSVPEDHLSLSPHASLFASSHVHISSQYRLPERSFHRSHFSKAFRDAVWGVL